VKRMAYVLIGALVFILLITIGYQILNIATLGNPNGDPPPDYPYFVTTGETTVKNIVVPAGTLLFYREQFLKNGKQDNMLNETSLTTIKLSIGKTIDWGGVPVHRIEKFFNHKMRGFTLYADFKQLSNDKQTKFSKLWQSADDQLGINVIDIDDWSFDKENIADVKSCGVNYQRYFTNNLEQQQFLDNLYAELKNIK